MLQLCLEELGFDILAISADDIENNKLDQFNVLAVGGGYHKYKSNLLTENGKSQIKNFIYNGGGFFGSCGGAAFTMNVSGGLNMIDAGRRATREKTFLSIITDYIFGCNNAVWPVQEIILRSRMQTVDKGTLILISNR